MKTLTYTGPLPEVLVPTPAGMVKVKRGGQAKLPDAIADELSKRVGDWSTAAPKRRTEES